MVWVYAFAAVVMLLAVAAVSWPLFLQQLEPYRLSDPPEPEFSERDALLEALSELEYSRAAGKVSPADYDTQRAELEARYVQVTAQPGA